LDQAKSRKVGVKGQMSAFAFRVTVCNSSRDRVDAGGGGGLSGSLRLMSDQRNVAQVAAVDGSLGIENLSFSGIGLEGGGLRHGREREHDS